MLAPSATALGALFATEAVLKADEEVKHVADEPLLLLCKYCRENVGCFCRCRGTFFRPELVVR